MSDTQTQPVTFLRQLTTKSYGVVRRGQTVEVSGSDATRFVRAGYAVDGAVPDPDLPAFGSESAAPADELAPVPYPGNATVAPDPGTADDGATPKRRGPAQTSKGE